ncbi:GatB/YqeY domain-containing protein [Candidatus Parcubacteria bacterium]|nr:GatB/YqeY domain-containing protein [Candidatus Parcubacteria bacterium]
MNLKDRIQKDLEAALRRQDKAVVSVLRLLAAAVHNEEIAKGKQQSGLEEGGVLDVVAREAKRRKESIGAYEKGGRADLVEQERAELAILYHYLPEPLDAGALEQLVRAAITETSATSAKDLGKVMVALRPRIAGRADGGVAAELVRKLLSG